MRCSGISCQHRGVAVAAGVRIGWAQLPTEVRCGVEKILGAVVVEAVSQVGGFSPGTADRVRTCDGRRGFVKAVSAAQNERTLIMHRREAMVTGLLPADVAAPKLLGFYDDGTWVALVFEDVDGRHPATPWVREELDRVMVALDRLARAGTPSPVPGLDPVAETLAHEFAGWDRIAADVPHDLDRWAADHLDGLRALTARGLRALDGQTLVHLDIRADNLLIGPDGAVTVVDWPWASRGPAWLDTLSLLIDVRFHGGHDTGALLRRCAQDTGADLDDLVAVLAGIGGYFVDVCRQPAVPGIPTVRGFQRVRGSGRAALAPRAASEVDVEGSGRGQQPWAIWGVWGSGVRPSSPAPR